MPATSTTHWAVQQSQFIKLQHLSSKVPIMGQHVSRVRMTGTFIHALGTQPLKHSKKQLPTSKEVLVVLPLRRAWQQLLQRTLLF